MNTPKEQAASEASDLFRLVIFHVPQIVGSSFARSAIRGDDDQVTYTYSHPYQFEGSEYEIEVELSISNVVVRNNHNQVIYTGRSVSGVSALHTPDGMPRCQYGEPSGQCILQAGHDNTDDGAPIAHEI